MNKRALITGITGQDGSHLADFLLAKGYGVYGLVRHTSTPNTARIEHLRGKIILIEGDLCDNASLHQAIYTSAPHEIYNLGGQSHVGTSFAAPHSTLAATGAGAAAVFQAAWSLERRCRIYQAGTSEMFGNQPSPQNEETRFAPVSPYSAAKLYAHNMALIHRAGYGQFIANGILFNHEGERRGAEFVTRTITKAVAEIKAGKRNVLELGCLTAKRDWGYAPEYVEAMWAMLQQDQPDDYVLGTGETSTVAEFCEAAFARAGLWWRDFVVETEAKHRVIEVRELRADASKAEAKLGWKPKVKMQALAELMTDHDLGVRP